MVSLISVETTHHTTKQKAIPRIERTIPAAAVARPRDPPGARHGERRQPEARDGQDHERPVTVDRGVGEI
jgi:hypothetical protein